MGATSDSKPKLPIAVIFERPINDVWAIRAGQKEIAVYRIDDGVLRAIFAERLNRIAA